MFIGRQNKIVDLWQLVPFISAHTKLTDTIHELINNSSPSRYLRNLSLVVKPLAFETIGKRELPQEREEILELRNKEL